MGMDMNVLETLLPFNLGLELGQLIIITCSLALIFALSSFKYGTPKLINYLISVPVLLQALCWMVECNIFGNEVAL